MSIDHTSVSILGHKVPSRHVVVVLAGVAGIAGSRRVAGVAGIDVRLAVIKFEVVAGVSGSMTVTHK